jgi:hypothetical protein
MKYFLLICVLFLSHNTYSQTGNIQFTVKRSPVQGNQIIVYGRNRAGITLSGRVGDASTITINIGVPKAFSSSPTISTSIPGAAFSQPKKYLIGLDSNFTFLGNTLSTASVSFPPNIEVELAKITFTTGLPGVTSVVKLVNNTNGGGIASLGNAPNSTNEGLGEEYNYIALEGTEHSGYTDPFYSSIASDPLLSNGNGPNDAFSQTYSSIGVADIALPTKFLSFIATKTDDVANLTWVVDNEEDNLYFDVQRSVDGGRTFIDALRVKALRNGRSSNSYTTPDVNLSRLGSKVLYYRIKQTEASGQIIYSDVRQINLDKKNFTIGLYPNPVVTSTILVIDAPNAGKAAIVVRDASGKTVQQISVELTKGINQRILDATMLASGEYNVTVTGTNLNQTIRLSKSTN